MRAPENSTRAISTSCCRPSGSAPGRRRGSTSMPSRCRCSPAVRSMVAPVDQAEAVERLHAEMHVLRHRQVAHDREFLMHHADAGGRASRAERNAHRLAVEPHRALVLGMHAGDDLHQRALAGAVLADQAVDFARGEGEIHVAQRRDAAERLGDPGKFQQAGRRSHRRRRIRSGSGPPSTSCRARWPW